MVSGGISMPRTGLLLAAALLAFRAAPAAYSAELYVVRVRAVSALNTDVCSQVHWQDNIAFYNGGAATATVRLLEVSNGGLQAPAALELRVPPGRSINSAGKVNWNPASADPIWVNKIDVPDGVLLRSRAEGGFNGCSIGGPPPSLVPDLGAFSLPIFDRLVTAGTPQVHLGADLGAQPGSLNVGVYNDGTTAATVSVEVRQVCDDSLREARSFTVPAKSLRQFGGLGLSGTSCPSPGSEFNAWMRYVTVTLDQPGFSYIVNRSVAIPTPPVIPYASP
jgi:hypothetical protein